MHLDVTEMQEFYASRLGGVARRLIAHHIRMRWKNVKDMRLVGVGYATPYLGQFRGKASHLAAFMPAGQGVITWPAGGPYMASLTEDTALPLGDASIDRLLAVHSLEMSEGASEFMREIWRVLRPEGRLILVVPNRRGPWAGPETTPFGYGHPYSRGQLSRLLKDAMFTAIVWRHALFVPPFKRRFLTRSAVAWERVGTKIWPAFSGVLIVEAGKEIMGALPSGRTAKGRARLQPVPAGALALNETGCRNWPGRKPDF